MPSIGENQDAALPESFQDILRQVKQDLNLPAVFLKRPLDTVDDEINSSTEKRSRRETASNYTPHVIWDKASFYDRLRSFTSLYLNTKRPVSASDCAMHGWKDSGSVLGDTRDWCQLVCATGCEGTMLMINLSPFTIDSPKVEAIVQKYQKGLFEYHTDQCMWRSRKCSSQVREFPIYTTQEAISLITSEAKQFLNCDALPIIQHPLSSDQLRKMDYFIQYTEGLLDEDGFIRGPLGDNKTATAYLLPLFGWHAASSSQAECHQCFRRIFLNTPTDNDDSTDHEALDVASEHRTYCPWINAEIAMAKSPRVFLSEKSGAICGYEWMMETINLEHRMLMEERDFSYSKQEAHRRKVAAIWRQIEESKELLRAATAPPAEVAVPTIEKQTAMPEQATTPLPDTAITHAEVGPSLAAEEPKQPTEVKAESPMETTVIPTDQTAAEEPAVASTVEKETESADQIMQDAQSSDAAAAAAAAETEMIRKEEEKAAAAAAEMPATTDEAVSSATVEGVAKGVSPPKAVTTDAVVLDEVQEPSLDDETSPKDTTQMPAESVTEKEVQSMDKAATEAEVAKEGVPVVTISSPKEKIPEEKIDTPSPADAILPAEGEAGIPEPDTEKVAQKTEAEDAFTALPDEDIAHLETLEPDESFTDSGAASADHGSLEDGMEEGELVDAEDGEIVDENALPPLTASESMTPVLQSLQEASTDVKAKQAPEPVVKEAADTTLIQEPPVAELDKDDNFATAMEVDTAEFDAPADVEVLEEEDTELMQQDLSSTADTLRPTEETASPTVSEVKEEQDTETDMDFETVKGAMGDTKDISEELPDMLMADVDKQEEPLASSIEQPIERQSIEEVITKDEGLSEELPDDFMEDTEIRTEKAPQEDQTEPVALTDDVTRDQATVNDALPETVPSEPVTIETTTPSDSTVVEEQPKAEVSVTEETSIPESATAVSPSEPKESPKEHLSPPTEHQNQEAAPVSTVAPTAAERTITMDDQKATEEPITEPTENVVHLAYDETQTDSTDAAAPIEPVESTAQPEKAEKDVITEQDDKEGQGVVAERAGSPLPHPSLQATKMQEFHAELAATLDAGTPISLTDFDTDQSGDNLPGLDEPTTTEELDTLIMEQELGTSQPSTEPFTEKQTDETVSKVVEEPSEETSELQPNSEPSTANGEDHVTVETPILESEETSHETIAPAADERDDTAPLKDTQHLDTTEDATTPAAMQPEVPPPEDDSQLLELIEEYDWGNDKAAEADDHGPKKIDDAMENRGQQATHKDAPNEPEYDEEIQGEEVHVDEIDEEEAHGGDEHDVDDEPDYDMIHDVDNLDEEFDEETFDHDSVGHDNMEGHENEEEEGYDHMDLVSENESAPILIEDQDQEKQKVESQDEDDFEVLEDGNLEGNVDYADKKESMEP